MSRRTFSSRRMPAADNACARELPERLLWMAVIVQALKDYYGLGLNSTNTPGLKERNMNSAKRFFTSTWPEIVETREQVFENAGLNPELSFNQLQNDPEFLRGMQIHLQRYAGIKRGKSLEISDHTHRKTNRNPENKELAT